MAASNDHEKTHGHGHTHDHQHFHEHSHTDENGNVYTHTHTHIDGEHHHDHGHIHSEEHTRRVLNRMSRIIGHMESTRRMVENGRDCSEVLIQLSAIESAINSVSRVILKEHLSTCVIDAVRRDDIEAIEELNRAIDKFIK
ncbi:MAG: metal-sensing transcriptional repressor [Mogibacterium sp.]|nr:metal-sensing transcriptional repressor [Mogibacterium sp.]